MANSWSIFVLSVTTLACAGPIVLAFVLRAAISKRSWLGALGAAAGIGVPWAFAWWSGQADGTRPADTHRMLGYAVMLAAAGPLAGGFLGVGIGERFRRVRSWHTGSVRDFDLARFATRVGAACGIIVGVILGSALTDLLSPDSMFRVPIRAHVKLSRDLTGGLRPLPAGRFFLLVCVTASCCAVGAKIGTRLQTRCVTPEADAAKEVDRWTTS